MPDPVAAGEGLLEFADDFTLFLGDRGGEDGCCYVLADEAYGAVNERELAAACVEAVKSIAANVGAHRTGAASKSGAVVQ